LNRSSLSFIIYSSSLDDTDFHKETLVFKKICKTFYTSTPAYAKNPCNEQAATTYRFPIGRQPQAVMWSLMGGLLKGGVNTLETSAHPAAWPALRVPEKPFLLLQSLPTAPQQVVSTPHTATLFAQANGHLPAFRPPSQKTALPAHAAELVTTEMCLQSGISAFDLADGAAADSSFPAVT
jgi:hypothetical protein